MLLIGLHRLKYLFVFDGQPHNELEDGITYPLTITSTPVISGGSYGAAAYAYYNYVSSVCETTPLAGAPTNVGTYCVAATIPDDANPPANYLGGTTDPVKLLTITQNQLVVDWASPDELSVPYNGAPHAELEDIVTYPLTITSDPIITDVTYGATTYVYYNYLGSAVCEAAPLAGAPTNVGSYCVTASIPDDVDPPANYLGGTTDPARLLTITPLTDLIIEFNPTTRTEPYSGNPIPWNEADISLSSVTAGGPVAVLPGDVITFNYFTDPGLSSPANLDLESGSKVGSVPVDAGTYYVTAVIDPNDNHNGATTALYAILTITPAETELKATWPADNVLRVAITVDNLAFPGEPISGTVSVYSDPAMTVLVASQAVSGTIPLTVVFENLPEGVERFYVKFESASVNFNGSEGDFVPGEDTYFFTVTYNSNGADAGDVPTDPTGYVLDAVVTVAGNTGTIPLSRTGYFFGGWYRENDLTTVYGPEYTPSFQIISDTDMYAKWGFGIVYAPGDFAEGGIAPVDNKNPYDTGETFTILNNSMTNPIVREGYHFQKWNTAPDGTSGIDYFIGRSYVFPAARSNLTLYPHWEANFPRPDGEPGQEGWYLIGDPRIPGGQRTPDQPGEPRYPDMPHTGFSTKHLTVLREQPAALTYRPLNIEIELPTLNVRTELVTVPEDEGGSWAVDWLGDRAGLLDGSVVPGMGTSYIAAHNHLNDMEIGPFLFILDLAENDRIFVRNEDEELLTYSVYANELFEPDDFAGVKEKAAQYENSLVLITCENESEDGGYLNRRVVFAKLL
ncbi:MAG: InlB B-repeat-containing protein [Flexilinea sp.]